MKVNLDSDDAFRKVVQQLTSSTGYDIQKIRKFFVEQQARRMKPAGDQGQSSSEAGAAKAQEDRQEGGNNKKRKATGSGELELNVDDVNMSDEDQEETTMIVNMPKAFDRKLGKLPPPITVDRPATAKETHNLLHHLQDGLQYEAIKQVFLKHITVKCNTMEDYDAVCTKLRDREEGWHTYTAKSRLQLRMVMTNAPNLYADEEYKSLNEQAYALNYSAE